MLQVRPLALLALLPLTGLSGISTAAEQNHEVLDKASLEYGSVVSRIIGGERAAEGAWPSAVALVRNTNQSLFQRQFCGANLINSRWAVTAAHCLFDSFGVQVNPADIRLAIGFNDLADEASATEVVIASLFIHPQYENSDASAPHDLALIELAQITSVEHMRLFQGDAREQAGTAAVVVGWGVNDFSNPSQPLFPSELNQVSVPVVSTEICNAPQSYAGLLGEGQICAGLPQGGRDSCLGDSGGPLMIRQDGEYKQIGVVSFGRGCAEPNFYGVYTRLEHYKTWIGDITGISDFNNPDLAQGISSLQALNGQAPDIIESNSQEKAAETGGGGSFDPLFPLLMLLISTIICKRGNRQIRAGESAEGTKGIGTDSDSGTATAVQGEYQ